MDEPKVKLRFTSSWDDGDERDYKLAELLLKHRLPGIFYMPSLGVDIKLIEFLFKSGFEIGGHTVSHPQDLKILDDNDLDYEIMVNKDQLESVIGQKITKFCYPRGRYDDRVIEAVKKAGYIESRTTEVFKTDRDDPMKTPSTIHVFPRKEYEGKPWHIVAKAYAKHAADVGGLFHIWGHSWEIEQLNQWDELDAFFNWLTYNYQLTYN